MSVLTQLASAQGRRDEVPNQELAKDLVQEMDKKGIKELADNLWNNDKNIAFDCIKVLYEVGYLEPRLISQYAEDFVRLLSSKNNRMVWGGALALSTIAGISADILFPHTDIIINAVRTGSVITQDNGIGALAIIASKNNRYRKRILPFLFRHLETCRPQSLPQHSEKTLCTVNKKNADAFIHLLEKRLSGLTLPQRKRVKKVIKQAEIL
jgi:hypothetical protein